MLDATELLMFFRFAHMLDATELLMFFRFAHMLDATKMMNTWIENMIANNMLMLE